MTKIRKASKKFISILPLLFMITASSSHASENGKPLWELGLTGGYFSIPHYVGSSKSYSFPLLGPYFIYRGERLKVSRDGARGIFYSSDMVSVDLSLAGGLPVRSSANGARKDMPDLKLSGEAGPRVNIRLTKVDSPLQTTFRISYRGAWDIRGDYLGSVVTPELVVNRNILKKKWNVALYLAYLYGSKRYNETYYSVLPRFSAPGRSSFDASEGLVAYMSTLSSNYRISKATSIWAYGRWYKVGDDNRESPLVDRDDNYLISVGFVWTFWASKQIAGPPKGIIYPNENGP